MFYNKEYMDIRDFDNCVSHINSEIEIVVIESGTATVIYDNKEIELNENEAAVIFPYRIHGFNIDKDSKGTVYMFSYSVAKEFYDKYNLSIPAQLKFRIPPQLKTFLDYSRQAIKDNCNVFTIKGIFNSLISEYLFNTTLVPGHDSSASATAQIINYIMENIDSDLTLEKISKALNINKTTLSQSLKKFTGISFSDFINNTRIEKSRTYLLFSNINITEIAYTCGFGSLRNFNRVFSKALGCTPSEFRKKHAYN